MNVRVCVAGHFLIGCCCTSYAVVADRAPSRARRSEPGSAFRLADGTQFWSGDGTSMCAVVVDFGS